MGRPRLYDETTQQTLVRAAESLIAAGGASAVSVRRLAAAAGTSPRAVYSLFGSKGRLLSALCREAFKELARVLDTVPVTDDPARDLVLTGVDGFRRFALSHPNLFHLAFERVELGHREPEEATAAEQAMIRLKRRVERVARAGLSDGHSVELVATMFHALCQGLASMELQGRRWDPRSPQVVWTAALTALVSGLNTDEERSPKKRARRARRRVVKATKTKN
jgi:AcrR family transcriptional regulator